MGIGPISGSGYPTSQPSPNVLIAELKQYAAEFNNAVNAQNYPEALAAYKQEEQVFQQLQKVMPNNSVMSHINMYLSSEKQDLAGGNSPDWYLLAGCAENMNYLVNQL